MATVTTCRVGTDVYVHGHLADDRAAIVSAFTPYVGRNMTAHIWDRSALKTRRIRLESAKGTNVTFTYGSRRFTMDAFDVLGQRCTIVHDVR